MNYLWYCRGSQRRIFVKRWNSFMWTLWIMSFLMILMINADLMLRTQVPCNAQTEPANSLLKTCCLLWSGIYNSFMASNKCSRSCSRGQLHQQVVLHSQNCSVHFQSREIPCIALHWVWMDTVHREGYRMSIFPFCSWLWQIEWMEFTFMLFIPLSYSFNER